MIVPNCPYCGAPMVERKGRYGDFYGCRNYPRCRGTRPRPKVDDVQEKLRRFASFTWSTYQKDIFQLVEDWEKHGRHLIVWAVAGSGKTTVLEYVACRLPSHWRTVYAVFNKRNQIEAKDRMPKHVVVSTTHGLGFYDIRKNLQHKVELDETKVKKIVKRLIQETWELEKHLVTPVCSVVSKLKNTLMEPSVQNVLYIIERWNIDVGTEFARVSELAAKALRLNNQQLATIDFDDMIYLPVKLRMRVRQWDVVLGDEVQDWNRSQLEYLQKAVRPGGHCLVVGDKYQSIYGFRGADTEAMDRIREALQAQLLPLSISYRCPKSNVRFVNALFPEVPFESAPNALEGSVESVPSEKFLDVAASSDGAMTLCRTNAPLVKPVLGLLKRGVKAFIVGRDIGVNLVSLARRFEKAEISEMLLALRDYEDKEVARLVEREQEIAAQMLMDKVEAIVALSEGLDTVDQLADRISSIFDDENGEGRMFSTVHRAKGLEAETVFILEPENIPHPMAKKAWEKEQERNIAYVAYTRSKDRLIFVGDIPPVYMGEQSWEGLEPIELTEKDKEYIEQRKDLASQVYQAVGVVLEEDQDFVTGEGPREKAHPGVKDLQKLGTADIPERFDVMPWDDNYFEYWPEMADRLEIVTIKPKKSLLDVARRDALVKKEEVDAPEWIPDKGPVELDEIDRRMKAEVEYEDSMTVPPCPF